MIQIHLICMVFLVPSVLGNWHDQGEVCFGTKGDSFGKFNLTKSGKFKAIELTHKNGFVSCFHLNPKIKRFGTYWGCAWNNEYIGTVVTTSADAMIFPRNQQSGWFREKGFNGNSTTIVFTNWVNPIRAAEDQEFRIWYNEDLLKSTVGDNVGKACAIVRTYIE